MWLPWPLHDTMYLSCSLTRPSNHCETYLVMPREQEHPNFRALRDVNICNVQQATMSATSF